MEDVRFFISVWMIAAIVIMIVLEATIVLKDKVGEEEEGDK